MRDFEEKRIYLIRQMKLLTATNKLVMDKFKIPKIKELIQENNGHFQKLVYNNRNYYMLFAHEEVIELSIDIMTFVYSNIDVTEQIVSGSYNRIVECFEVELFYQKYEDYYLSNCTLDYAKKNILSMKKPRSIDYKILNKYNEKL